MYLTKDQLQHINTVTHEGKVVVFATNAKGEISYTVKQDGFEDSYLNTPADLRTGWETWQRLEFPNEADDHSVIKKEQTELTYQKDLNCYLLKSRYATQGITAVAPVQVISALGHIYVFRQSTGNTLLVDRFVLDGMTNKLNRKLEVRFKRSKQKHESTKNMQRGAGGLVNIDTLDFRDANGNFFYEPTTELCLVSNLYKGWFSVVLVPTVENDVHRWHIFAYNSQTQKVELTTIRASETGLFDVKDYTVFEESNDSLVPRRIPGVIKRTLDISGVTVTNGLSATKYDLQQAQQTQSGEEQLLKTATRLMVAIPTDRGTAAFSFAIAGDGTLAEIDETPDSTIIRSRQREVLLPLNTLDEIKGIGDRTPPPQGVISGFAEGTDEENIEDLVKLSTNGRASELANGDLVKISGTSDYQGLYQAVKVDEETFDVDMPLEPGLGYWEKEDPEAGGLFFDGMITAYQKTADGKLRVTCPNHGLEKGDLVQIAGTQDYNDTYPVQKIDDTHFVIERKWATGEAINVKLVSQKRRGIVFDGVDDYVSLPDMNHNFSEGITIEAWVWYDSFQSWSRIIDFGNGPDADNILFANEAGSQNLKLLVSQGNRGQSITAASVLEIGKWMHLAATIDGSGIAKLYKNGEQIQSGKVQLPNTLKRTKNYIGKSNWGADSYFKGKVSDFRLWKTARTAEDIKNSMYLQLTGKEVGLVGYWRLGGISEGKVVDFAVNCNDGTVYGEPYISAATLNRKLAGGTTAVKYSNPELFAVSERATYEESFEFKVNSTKPVNLAYLDNADGKNLGTKIFSLSYWGKTSRSAEEKKPISAVQNKFEDLGNGWYRASCNVTIPDQVSLLRSFEIANVQGDWQSLEIRKHRIRLLSDTITEAKYTDGVSLITLVDDHATLTAKLKELELKEKQEGVLLKEKQELEAKIAAYDAQNETRAKIRALEAQIAELTGQEKVLSSQYQKELNSPFNYYCTLSFKAGGDRQRVQVIGRTRAFLELTEQPIGDWHEVKFTPTNSPYGNDGSDGCYLMSFKAGGDGRKVQMETVDNCWRLVCLKPTDQLYGEQFYKFRFTSTGDGYYVISCILSVEVFDRKQQYRVLEGTASPINDWQKVKLTSTGEQTNNNIGYAYESWQAILPKLNQAKEDLKLLNAGLTATAADKAAWDARLAKVKSLITALQTELNTLNTDFINAVKNTQARPQTMPKVAKDGKGLVTQGALLGFVQPASRLNALETCEGNVQLSYVDREGRMRQTNYDATADAKNSAFEQWIPDAQRACLNFNSNSVVNLNQALYLTPDWSIEAWFVYPLPEAGEWNTLTRGKDVDHHIIVRNRKQIGTYLNNDPLGQNFYDSGFNMEGLTEGWHHLTAVGCGETTLFYIDGNKVGDVKAQALKDAEEYLKKNPNDAAAKQKVEAIKKATLKSKSDVYAIGNAPAGGQPFGKVAEVRVWRIALSDEEIAINSTIVLSGNEPGLLAYYPMGEATGVEVRDHSGNGHNGTVSAGNWWGFTGSIGNINHPSGADAVVCAEYSTVTLESSTKTKVAIMRRFFAYPSTNGVTLLPDQRIEALELKWIGNAQFAPTLLGYIEGPPPVPSENLTCSDDYNGATSVELTMSEDVEFNWHRSQDSGLGATVDAFIGAGGTMSILTAPMGVGTSIDTSARVGFKGNFDFSYQFQNESSITSSSSLSMTDKLELRGTPEEIAKFPHLGTRFIPKNIGYALVVSALADVFVTRLARSGKMVGYQVQPVDGIPPDINTITFLMNPAYTMNGSLDGMTGSSATSDRFFKHVPAMRSQYGSLYPASYYRLKEAYDLKRQIEAEDKRRESYFSNFDVRLLDETSLNRNIDSGNAPTTIGVQREEDKSGTQMTNEEKKKAQDQKAEQFQADAAESAEKSNAAAKAKRAEIQNKVRDQEKQVHATESFAGWQRRMESIQIRSGKSNIVNTYVWDADGGLRIEAQSFANTLEHSIGGSFAMNAGVGVDSEFAVGGVDVELTAQATVNLTQTMSKTETRSKGFELTVDLSGLEYKCITNYKDNPIMPGEKVDRYRFMSFYLEGSTNHFQDFFNYVVDPEWLISNDEEARALRQVQAGKPNKTWRVLHRVTYVERPALMGFGRDLRNLRSAAEVSESQKLLDKISELEKKNGKLEEKLDAIISLLKERK